MRVDMTEVAQTKSRGVLTLLPEIVLGAVLGGLAVSRFIDLNWWLFLVPVGCALIGATLCARRINRRCSPDELRDFAASPFDGVVHSSLPAQLRDSCSRRFSEDAVRCVRSTWRYSRYLASLPVWFSRRPS